VVIKAFANEDSCLSQTEADIELQAVTGEQRWLISTTPPRHPNKKFTFQWLGLEK